MLLSGRYILHIKPRSKQVKRDKKKLSFRTCLGIHAVLNIDPEINSGWQKKSHSERM